MNAERYEILSVAQLREKYDLVGDKRPEIHLNPAKVPEGLRHLIPYAELWGSRRRPDSR
ncbi:MAG TPA: hypothetical protein PLP42_03070 [Acidobacteriota bacterium]|nr:hypothetical protein [Acidobacteriota bacterium]